MTATTEQTSEITVSREIAASAETLYRLWIDPAAMRRWFGVDGITLTGSASEPVVGGAWRIEAEGENGPFAIEGRYKALDPGKRIVQSWQHVGGDGTRGNETEAEVLFETKGSGTRVTVTQSLARLARVAGAA